MTVYVTGLAAKLRKILFGLIHWCLTLGVRSGISNFFVARKFLFGFKKRKIFKNFFKKSNFQKFSENLTKYLYALCDHRPSYTNPNNDIKIWKKNPDVWIAVFQLKTIWTILKICLFRRSPDNFSQQLRQFLSVVCLILDIFYLKLQSEVTFSFKKHGIFEFENDEILLYLLYYYY